MMMHRAPGRIASSVAVQLVGCGRLLKSESTTTTTQRIPVGIKARMAACRRLY